MIARRALLVTPVFQPKDAIGNDVLGMRNALRELGWDAVVYGGTVDPSMKEIAKTVEAPFRNVQFRPGDVMIYHHSIGCGWGRELVEKATCPVVIRHHNVTPPQFFAPYSQAYVVACKEGLRDTAYFARKPGLHFMAASDFNRRELITAGAPAEACGVVPPFHHIEMTAKAPFHPPTLRRYKDGVANIVFVGGIKPNKGHMHAIRSLSEYLADGNRPARLIFVGSVDNRLEAYAELLREVARQCGVEDKVILTGRVSDSELRTFYMVADMFLCQSDHEGFCVPLTEAMYFRVPLLACGTTAVKETIGDAGIVWSTQTAPLFAETIKTFLDNPELCRELRWRGRQRYDDYFQPSAITAALNMFIRSMQL